MSPGGDGREGLARYHANQASMPPVDRAAVDRASGSAPWHPTVRDAAIVRLRNEARGITEEPATISREEAQARAAGEVLLPDIGRATSYDEDQARVQAMLARAEADVRRERADPGTQGRTRDRGGFDHRNIRVRGSRGRDYPPATRGDRAGRQR